MGGRGLHAGDTSGPTKVSHPGVRGPALSPLKLRRFSVELATTATIAAVTLVGEADVDVMERLGRYFSELHREVNRLRLTEVVVDLQGLCFINSSCLRQFGMWLARMAKAADGERYRVTLSLNAAAAWQKRSFEPLQYVAPGLVTVL